MSRLQRFLEDASEDVWTIPEELNQIITSDQLKGITKSETGISFIEFDFGHVKYSNEVHHLKGKIPFFNPIESYPPASCEEFNYVINLVREFYIKHELIYEYEIEKLKKLKVDVHTAIYIGLTALPEFFGKLKESEDVLHLLLAICLVIGGDDILENVHINGATGRQFAQFKPMVDNIIDGEEIDLNLAPFLPAELIKYINLLKWVYTKMKTNINQGGTTEFTIRKQYLKKALWNTFFAIYTIYSNDCTFAPKTKIKSVGDCMGKIQSTGFQREKSIQMPEKALLELLRRDKGSDVLLEYFLMVIGIELNEEIREHFWFKQLFDSHQAMVEYANAVIGIHVDLEKDQISSITYKIKMKGDTVENAFNEVLQQFSDTMEEFQYAQTELMTSFPDSEELLKTIDVMERHIDCLSYTMMYTFRYGDIKYAFVK